MSGPDDEAGERIWARKSLGQHFLHDLNLTRKIASQAGELADATVIEVGPGPGGLTRALLETKLARLIVIEKDARFAATLRETALTEPRLLVIEGDALAIDEPALLAEAGATKPAIIIANLPYNVGTPLLIRWLKAGEWRGAMALMFQLEVAERICAGPGESAYGRLAIIAQSRSRPRLVMRVPARAFTPPPKVDSAVVQFEVSPPEMMFADVEALEAVTTAAFGQRRKMLRQSLKGLEGRMAKSAADLIAEAGLDPTQRAETVSVAGFQLLATAFRAASSAQTARAKSPTPD